MPRRTDRAPPPRKKSCIHCRTAKTRCNLAIPSCSRCSLRNIHCEYLFSNAESDQSSASPTASSEQSGTGSTPAAITSTTNGLIEDVTTTALTASDRDIHNSWLETNNLDFNDLDLDITNIEPQSPILSTPSADLISFSRAFDNDFTSSTDHTQPPFLHIGKTMFPRAPLQVPVTHQRQSSSMSSNFSTIPMPLSWELPPPTALEKPLLQVKKKRTYASWMASKHILGTIKQYPSMLMDGKQLPPFIHPHSPAAVGVTDNGAYDTQELPESLANCAAILNLFFHKTPASTPFVWRTIAEEHRRLAEMARVPIQNLLVDRWRLLHELQAMAIYVLLYASETKIEPSRATSLLLTLNAVVGNVYDYGNELSECNDLFPTWEDWIFRESMQRTFGLLFVGDLILNMQVDSPTLKRACSGFDNVLLPSVRGLWEAASQREWEKRYAQHLQAQTQTEALKLKHYRDTVKLERRTGDTEQAPIVKDLGYWCENVDEFGWLLITACMMAVNDEE